jgi:hypothetical protein
MKACEIIVRERQGQLEECKSDLRAGIKEGIKREAQAKSGGQESLFREWVRVCRSGDIDDTEASAIIVEMLEKEGAFSIKGRKEEASSEKDKEFNWEHREKTHELRRLTKELLGRVRSLRYFTVVRDLQRSEDSKKREIERRKKKDGLEEDSKEIQHLFRIDCPSCGRQDVPVAEASVLSSCGHTGCRECVQLCAEKEECVYAASGACKAAARVLNIVKADTLGTDDDAHDGTGKRFGKKLEQIIALIK